MGGVLTVTAALLSMGMGLTEPQGGQGGFGGQGGGGLGGGGFGGGGFGGAQGGQQGRQMERTLQLIDQEIVQYLSGKETKSILTPGEFTEWELELKQGQVVLAEARSDAFDPFLEITDAKEAVLEKNDDRFPGDQRPLLLWRCPKDGSYKLRGRSFQNKAGGQMFLRSQIYDSVDIGTGGFVDRKVAKSEAFLVRVSLKAGQIAQLRGVLPEWETRTGARFDTTISPIGLPDRDLGRLLDQTGTYTICAPISGDYFVLTTPLIAEGGTVRIRKSEIVAERIDRVNGAGQGQFRGGATKLWAVPVKAGEVLEVVKDGGTFPGLIVAEQPDVSKFDAKDPKKNPFYPKPSEAGSAAEEEPLEFLPARNRDARVSVFAAKRDVVLWVATSEFNGDKDRSLRIRSALKDLPQSQEVKGTLSVGANEYFTFDAKVGDVLRFQGSAELFAGVFQVRGPNYRILQNLVLGVDQTGTSWNMIVEEPGRYLVSISCLGDGGGGNFALRREQFSPRSLTLKQPAVGDLGDGNVHVWQLHVKPEEPLLVRWNSSDWTYNTAIRDETGSVAGLSLIQVDSNTKFGILKVEKPRTLTFVLMPLGSASKYEIEVSDLHGLKGWKGGGVG